MSPQPDPESPDQHLAVEVAVFSPLPGSFTYLWPKSLGKPLKGVRVQVPFGKGSRFGLVLEITAVPDDMAPDYKPVADRLDAVPLLDAARLAWLERVGRYYLASPGELWSTALGWALQDDLRRFRCGDPAKLSDDPLLLALFPTRAAVTLKTVLKRAAAAGYKTAVRHLLSLAVKDGLVEEVKAEPFHPCSEESLSRELTATTGQQRAIDALTGKPDIFNPCLLFGRTGSGKTEVYLKAAESVVANGGQVLVLVPEIGLTPMWLARLTSRFPRVATWHSALTGAERLRIRQHLDSTDVLIGTRSALFLPLPKLKMIVVDEEHDASFKQQEGMTYSARDMALLLAQELDIPVVLGSATPSLESWRQVKAGNYKRLDLPDRIAKHASVRSETVDMRGVDAPVSDALLAALNETKEAGDQSILFLNRRGYAPALQCTACGDVPECPGCSIRLTLHRRAGQLRCHTCGFRRRVPKTCESCGEDALMPLGEGMEKLEEWLNEHLPELRFERFDRDVITSHSRLENTLSLFESGELDCLIGTQMLVKGHDFPNVTLVGVVNADLGVSLPDFRAGERWWQQMTQVTGRAGRSEKRGRVIIQTRMPEAGWLSRISEDEAIATLDEELSLREMLHYPPYARWVRLVFSSNKIERATEVASQFARHCEKFDGINITGPMPCPMERVAGKFRIEVLLRDASRKLLPWKLQPLLSGMQPPRDVRIRVDVDPQDMM
ncbi:replication restart DNA helicase PriA [Mariprofundus ferrinatatus]|uniref:Replication restart protein PriA n=1 Tax=Mariprofundus ferrinatatus TaxID=1921087 RepID=A0A2K8L5C0_9PROT|nr:primosomal protein N' [Mariprofundus ferrinatatus]ATX81439.1 replication restart DNA helicase PriA [Mariprofundus ferrinatatus]